MKVCCLRMKSWLLKKEEVLGPFLFAFRWFLCLVHALSVPLWSFRSQSSFLVQDQLLKAGLLLFLRLSSQSLLLVQDQLLKAGLPLFLILSSQSLLLIQDQLLKAGLPLLWNLRCYSLAHSFEASLSIFWSFIDKSFSSLLQTPLALDSRLCGTPSSIPYSPLHQSCFPLFSTFRCTNPPLTFSSTAQSCFSFLLCIHNGSTMVIIKNLWTLNVHHVHAYLTYIYTDWKILHLCRNGKAVHLLNDGRTIIIYINE